MASGHDPRRQRGEHERDSRKGLVESQSDTVLQANANNRSAHSNCTRRISWP